MLAFSLFASGHFWLGICNHTLWVHLILSFLHLFSYSFCSPSRATTVLNLLGSIPMKVFRLLLCMYLSMNIYRIIFALKFHIRGIISTISQLQFGPTSSVVCSQIYPCKSSSFISTGVWYSIVWISHVYSSISCYGHWGYCPFPSLLNSAVKNIFVSFP